MKALLLDGLRALALAQLIACSADTTGSRATTLELTPASLDTIRALGTMQPLKLVVRPSGTAPLFARWSSSDSSVAVVVPDTGMSVVLESRGNGSARITAAVRDARGAVLRDTSLGVHVRQRAATAYLTPLTNGGTFGIGTTVRVAVRVADANGRLLAGTFPATFRSSAPEVVSVTSDGTLVGRAYGQARITADVATPDGTLTAATNIAVSVP